MESEIGEEKGYVVPIDRDAFEQRVKTVRNLFLAHQVGAINCSLSTRPPAHCRRSTNCYRSFCRHVWPSIRSDICFCSPPWQIPITSCPLCYFFLLARNEMKENGGEKDHRTQVTDRITVRGARIESANACGLQKGAALSPFLRADAMSQV